MPFIKKSFISSISCKQENRVSSIEATMHDRGTMLVLSTSNRTTLNQILSLLGTETLMFFPLDTEEKKSLTITARLDEMPQLYHVLEKVVESELLDTQLFRSVVTQYPYKEGSRKVLEFWGLEKERELILRSPSGINSLFGQEGSAMSPVATERKVPPVDESSNSRQQAPV
jgi:hypothetical protein